MRIRFFNTVEPVTTIYRDLLPYLAEKGWQVDVVISDTPYRTGRSSIEDELNNTNIHIIRMPAFGFRMDDKWGKLMVMIFYSAFTALYTLFAPTVCLNFFLTQPPIFSLWGFVLKIIRKQTYCVLTMDVYPDVAVRDGLLAENGIAYQILKSLSNLAIKNASRVIVIGRCMRDLLISRTVKPELIVLIPNWADTTNIYPIPNDHNPFRQALFREDDFVVLYSGNMGIPHYFDDILEVALRVRGQNQIKFVFIGDGKRRMQIEAFKESHQLENLILLPFQSTKDLAFSLNIGDVHFVSLRSGFEGIVVPSKAYGAFAAGKPVIYQGNKSGEIPLLLEENGLGIVVEIGDIDALYFAVMKYYRNKDKLTAYSPSFVNYARNYSINQSVQNYECLLKSVVASDIRYYPTQSRGSK